MCLFSKALGSVLVDHLFIKVGGQLQSLVFKVKAVIKYRGHP
jgi:hypothetical protein